MLGGLKERREIIADNKFENDFHTSIGAIIKSDPDKGSAVWSALANVEWHGPDGEVAGYSFRAAGDLIAASLGAGNYMDWYCSAQAGQVEGWIEEALGKFGWTPQIL